MTLIEQLKEKTNRLKALLDDPQPGLATWNKAVGDALTSLAEHAPEPKDKK